ncbi:MAG: alanine--glyoxylate aminotransferase family protein, partial [Myxococcota bacterium]
MSETLLLTPGPTPVPESVRLAMARALMHHRTDAFTEVFLRAQAGLKWAHQTEDDVVMLTCSGTGAFEAAMIAFTSSEDTIVCVGGGKFGERWSAVGRAYGMNVVELPVEWGKQVDPQMVARALAAHPECAMVTVSASETSTGVLHPVQELGEVVKKHSSALLVVDGITAVGVHPLPMAEWGIDVLVSGSQKAFSLPPGMAFVAAGERSWSRAVRSDHRRYYLDLVRERDKQRDGQTAFTPAISLVVGLDEVVQLMQERGRERGFLLHAKHARGARAGLEALGLTAFAQHPSHALTSATMPQGVFAPAVLKHMRQ